MCSCLAAGTLAQTASPSPSPEPAKTPESKPAGQGGGNPFALESAPPLPAGMTGSDANDPRAKLSPGLYDAGEAAMGMRHVTLVKKPDAFQLGSDDPDNPKVQKTLGLIGVGDTSKMPKSQQLVLAQLAFSNSDLAFRGNHLFMGNFYGVNIFDISDPAKARLLTSMVCPGGQGDVSVYKNLLFMSVEMPNGRLDCSPQGFRRSLRPPPRKRTAASAGRAKRSLPRGEDFRHRRHREPEAGGGGANMPRLAHAHLVVDPMIRTTSTSTSREPLSSARAKSWPGARARRRTRTPTPRSFALT